MFSYVDLIRLEIATEAETQFNVTISDQVTAGWRTLGDVARSIVGHSGATATEAEVFNWIRTLLVEGYGATEVADLTADGDVFSDYDRAHAWFSAPPYPHRLADRWFAGQQSGHSGAAPYYCAYGAPTDLRIIPPAWRTDTVVLLARRMYESRDFSAMPILADALQEAGCDDSNTLHRYMLHHCRNPVATHIHGCWVVDLILGEGRYRAEPGAAADGGA